MHQNNILSRVQTLALRNQSSFRENLLNMFVPLFGDVDLMGFFIYPIVTFSLFGRLAR